MRKPVKDDPSIHPYAISINICQGTGYPDDGHDDPSGYGHLILDTFCDFYFEYYRRMFEVACDLIDVFAHTDELCMQNTLLISPELFEEYFAPPTSG